MENLVCHCCSLSHVLMLIDTTGAGSGLSNSSPYKVHHITKFYEPSDLNNTLPTPDIGYVSYTETANFVILLYPCMQVACGEKFTLVLTQDGTSVFGFGVRGSGQFGRDNWTPKEVFVPVVSVYIVLS